MKVQAALQITIRAENRIWNSLKNNGITHQMPTQKK